MRRVFSYVTGKYLELPDKCKRVVSFSPAVSDSIVSMGVGEILKGISVYCVHPDESIREGRKIVGSYSSYKKEVLDEINPDVVFTTSGYQVDLAQKLAEFYPVYVVRLPLTLSDLIATCVEVGLVCGYHEEAKTLERDLMSFISKYLSTTEERLKVYIEVDLGEPVTFGAYSYITDTLGLLGFENIFGDHPAEWLKPNPNFIREKEPDLIIYEPRMFSRSKDVERITDSLHKRFGDLKAIRERRIFLTPGNYDFFAHHGPSFVYRSLPFLSSIKEQLLSR